MGRSWVVPSAVIAAAMMFTVMVPVGEASASSTTVVFSTDFEGVGFFISAWEPLGWSRGEYATGHDDDQWCRANSTWLETLSNAVGYPITARSSPSALYGAKLGTNSNNGAANIANGYPDPGMDAWVRFAPANAASYDGMTLTFWYWARTQSASYAGELTDYLCVNINDGTTTTRAWMQPSADSNGWQMATVELPAGTVWMEWEFKTGPAPEGGHYPGVLIDDVTVTTDSVVSASPSSRVGTMSAYYVQRDVQVPVTVSNADHLSLYYRTNGGTWTVYTDSDHPDGQFAISTITFHAPSDGRYELFTIANGASGPEGMKSVAEALFTIDTAAPTVTVTAPEQGAIYGDESLSLAWAAEDQVSGIARTEVRVDGGAWATVSTASYPLGILGDGPHTASVRVTDRAGSSAEASVSFVIDPTAPAMTVSPVGDRVLLNITIVASFQEVVDHDSVAIEVGGVTGEMSWRGDDAVFTPSSPLEPERTYAATVTGRKAGGQAFSLEWSFTTVENKGSISGTVHDADGIAVFNATVSLSNGVSTTTDAFGHFELTGIIPGEYSLTVSGEGYEDMTMKVTVIAGEVRELGALSVDADTPQASGIDLTFVAPLLVAVAALGAVALVVIRKRKR